MKQKQVMQQKRLMKDLAAVPKQVVKDLAAVPKHIAGLAAGRDETRLTSRADAKTWSASDVLAHLRSCAEVRGKWIAAIL